MEIKLIIPDNCELVQEGNTCIVKEKQKILPKTWEEFCKIYPNTTGEYYISAGSNIIKYERINGKNRDLNTDKNLCSSKEEVEAFLALMQLRRLRNTWTESTKIERPYYSIQYGDGIIITTYSTKGNALTFPTETMAKEFAECFKNLIVKAKILL